MTMEGMNDVPDGGWHGSWNVSSSVGPLGEVCEVGLHHDYPCYASCDYDCRHVDATCDFSSCHDDVTYTETVLYDVLGKLCVDTGHVHMSGAR